MAESLVQAENITSFTIVVQLDLKHLFLLMTPIVELTGMIYLKNGSILPVGAIPVTDSCRNPNGNIGTDF